VSWLPQRAALLACGRGPKARSSARPTLDPGAWTVAASGTFVHYRADGTAHCKGTWRATALTGWTDFGGNHDGEHGGVVSLVITHYCTTMRMVHANVPMTVTSTLNAPSDSYVEGTTMGDFTVPTGGSVVIAGK